MVVDKDHVSASEPGARLRRHWVISGVGTVVVLVLGVVHHVVTRPVTPQCAIDSDLYLVGVWDAPTRAQIKARLAAVNPAASLSGDLIDAVDDHVDSWAIASSATCDGLAKAGGDEPRLLVQHACLAIRLEELRAAVRVLRAIGPDTQTWADAVGKLQSIEDCEDVQRARTVVLRSRAAAAQ